MFRRLFSGNLGIGSLVKSSSFVPQQSPLLSNAFIKNYSTTLLQPLANNFTNQLKSPAVINPSLKTTHLTIQSRSIIIKYSYKGKRTSESEVTNRFFRLGWGMWIRRIAGCHNKKWRKKQDRINRLHQHVMVTASQAWMLDKMVTKQWRRRRYYIEDPYEPYHSREEFPYSRQKPRELPY